MAEGQSLESGRSEPKPGRRLWRWGLGCGLLLVIAGGWLVGSCFRAVPFSGPRAGQVLDAASGKPIPSAVVEATWTCYDDPMPLSHQSRSVNARASADAAGKFTLSGAGGRRGLMGTDFVVRFKAEGYIAAVFILDPNGTPLPPQTVAWPFATTKTLTRMPESMTVKLKPALPVLIKAAGSQDKLIRQTAIEELEKLARQGRSELGASAKKALENIKTKGPNTRP